MSEGALALTKIGFLIKMKAVMNTPKDTSVSEKKIKKPYRRPSIKSEKLNSYGAVCNGTTNGGRKAATTGPSFCNSTRLMS